MAFRTTMIFQSFAGRKDDGWSEEVIDIASANFPAAQIHAQVLANARGKCLGLGVKLEAIRIEQLDPTTWLPVRNGQAKTIVFNPDITYNAVISGTGQVSIVSGVSSGSLGNVLECYWNFGITSGNTAPYQQVLADFSWSNYGWTARGTPIGGGGGGIAHRTFNVRGNPDSVQEIDIDDPRFPSNANVTVTQTRWGRNLSDYRNLLIDGSWGMAALDRSNANPNVAITGYTQDAVSGRVTFNAPGAGFTGSQVAVRVSRLNLINVQNGMVYKNLNGLWTCLVLDANNIQTIPAFPPLTGLTILNPKSARLRVQKYVGYVLTEHSDLTFWSSRKTGGPFFRSRGRRTAKRG
jgi:hypothetical protein